MSKQTLQVKDAKTSVAIEGDYAGEIIIPNTRFNWEVSLDAGEYAVELEFACHRHQKGAGFEIKVGDQVKRCNLARTEDLDDFRTMRLGIFNVPGGEIPVEFLVVTAAAEHFGRIRALHFIPAETAPTVSVESIEIPDLEYDKVSPTWELWAADFIGAPGKDIEIRLETDSTYQTIKGIGGTFNEQGGQCISALSEDAKSDLMNKMFGDDGATLSYCCLPVGASDFGLSVYSLDDTPDDYQMENFSTERDEKFLIPYIKAAQKVNPNLKFHARPWSPPAWMKTTGSMNTGRLRKDDAIYQAHALYLCKFCEEMKKLGVPVDRIVIQNEPDVSGGYSGCIWRPDELATFVTDFFGPLAKERNLDAEIWAGSFQGIWKPTAQRVAASTGLLDAVDGVAFQYNLIDNVIDFRLRHPQLPIMHTESPCHDGQNSWTQAFALYQDIINYLNAGADAYTYWNMILDAPGRSYTGWSQNSLINIDKLTGEIRYNPDFQVFSLFTRGIKPGAKRIEAFCFGKRICGVQNPDGSICVLVDNPAQHSIRADLVVNGAIHPVTLPACSLSTIRFDKYK